VPPGDDRETPPGHAPDVAALEAEIVRLNKVVRALMDRAESATNAQGSDYGLFQTTVMLQHKVRLRTEERREADQLQSLYVESARGTLIPLESFARVTVEPVFATIPHFNQLRTVTVNAMAPVGVLPSAILQAARAELHAIPLPAGYSLTFAGEDKELKESRSEMGLVMIVSLAAIFLAIVVQFRSVAKAVAVMVTVPVPDAIEEPACRATSPLSPAPPSRVRGLAPPMERVWPVRTWTATEDSIMVGLVNEALPMSTRAVLVMLPMRICENPGARAVMSVGVRVLV